MNDAPRHPDEGIVREGRRAPFKQLPDAVMDDDTLAPEAKLTYWYLKRIAGFSDQRARVSISRLAEKMGYSRTSKRSARGWIDALVQAGWVDVVHRKTPDGKINLVSEYVVHEMLDTGEVGVSEHPGVGAGEPLGGGWGAPRVGAGEPHGSRRCSSLEGCLQEQEQTSSSEVADATPDQEVNPQRPGVEQLCSTLRDSMIENGCKPPVITKRWRDAARLLLDTDKRPLDEALDILTWSQADEFWRTNIHSLPKFRTQYDQLRLRWQQSNPVRHLRSPDAIRHWLREQWRQGYVSDIEQRSGLRYPLPDLPDHVQTAEDAKTFHIEAMRTWITDHHDEITDLIARRERPEAS